MKILAPFRFTVEIAVRNQLCICNDHYAIASVIAFICNDPKNKEREATGDYRKVVAECVGISEKTTQRGIDELVKKGILEKVSRQVIKLTPKWKELHVNIPDNLIGDNPA